MQFHTLMALGALAVALGGCGKAPETTEAVRQAVIDHVATRVNLSSMDVNVSAVNFKGDTADATVDFRPKGGDAGSGIQMKYSLERKSGKWTVKGKSEAAGSPHGGGMMPGQGMPPGHPAPGAEPAVPRGEAKR